MQRWIVRATLIFAAAAIVAAAPAGWCAEGDVPDVIRMENPAYEEHKRGIVEFTHKAHSEEYAEQNPELYEHGCGTCHHDDQGEPLTDLAAGDPVDLCIDCHDKPGEMPRDVKKELRAEGLSRDEMKSRELEYHAEALHESCIGCHRDFKKQTRSRAAPTTCSKCHPRDK